ncbi:tandem-95 repeat protein, partial [Candidatus Poribacteria bacterium]
SVTVLDQNGFAVPAQSLAGDIGAGISSGNSKFITWDYVADMVDICAGTYQVRVIADDSSAGTPSVYAPEGEFQMGSDDGDDDEGPMHMVYVDAFYMDIHEVTNAQYQRFMDATGHSAPLYWSDSRFSAPDQPVVGVTWYDAVAYAEWAGKRLPTEAEWEKAARGGLSSKKYVWGDDWPPPEDAGNFPDSITGYDDGYVYTAPVGSFSPNRYGLHDMAGNIWEWCQDWYDSGYYSTSPMENPTGANSGTSRVVRGGSWFYHNQDVLRVTYRGGPIPSDALHHIGFRCVSDNGHSELSNQFSLNEGPVAVDDPITTDEDVPVTIPVAANDTDVDGNLDPTSVAIETEPSDGKAVNNGDGTITYTPDTNFNGEDTFSYQVSDTCGLSDTATVTITVTPVNDAPVANDDSAPTDEDNAVEIPVAANDTDVDGNLDPASIVIETEPANGEAVIGENNIITYTPDEDFNGEDSFEYKICDTGADGDGNTDEDDLCDIGTVTITIASVNDAPVANDDSVSTDEDNAVDINVAANDTDVDGNLDPASVAITSGPSNGLLVNNGNGTVTYTPNENYNGSDSFTYSICDTGEDGDGSTDGDDLCDTAIVTINIAPVNDAPVAEGDLAETDEDIAVEIPVADNDTDVDGNLDLASITIVSGPSHGSALSNEDGSITYTPAENYNGPDSITYSICDTGEDGDGSTDGDDLCATATVDITVNPVNDPPTVSAGGPYDVYEADSVQVSATGSDIENNLLTYAWDLDGNGSFEAPGQSVIFSAENLDGPSVHTIVVQITEDMPDGLSATSEATVNVINVAPNIPDNQPSASGYEGSPVTVIVEATDPAGVNDPLAYSFDWNGDGDYDDEYDIVDQADPFASHTWYDNGTYPVGGQVNDGDGGFAVRVFDVAVSNVAPTVYDITGIDMEPALVGTPITPSADFSDPGVFDTHTAVWDWGDGNTSDGGVTEADGNGNVTGSHDYDTPGVYTVKLVVTDKDGGSGSSTLDHYVVIYDPDGGFVTGGGWINSPAGAYIEDGEPTTFTGKANFGFVSKYKKKDEVPTGNTQFVFKAGDLKFHSTSYEWLVVAHHKAKYKGSGTVNGDGDYGFMLSAIDADLTPSTDVDLFRIKIWDKDDGDSIIYDNQMEAPDNADPTTAIGGGSIVIHGTEAEPEPDPPAAPALLPHDTVLLLAYPNPTNPDVWIPYRLSNENQVTIRVYNVSGHMVRKLDLGHKPAGLYSDKSKAAYWDGRNEAGEQVSSGIYFYNIQAGEYTATRKMIVRR